MNIIEGDIISGKNGLNKTVSKFAIGAMELKDVVKYIGNQTLLIVGNRPEVQMEALKRGSGILITGGFSTAKILLIMQINKSYLLFLQIMIHFSS